MSSYECLVAKGTSLFLTFCISGTEFKVSDVSEIVSKCKVDNILIKYFEHLAKFRDLPDILGNVKLQVQESPLRSERELRKAKTKLMRVMHFCRKVKFL